MKSVYFCQHHANRIQNFEIEAMQSWSGVMHRGTKAYSECRLDAAEIYLGSALDIALLRSRSSVNTKFQSVHLLKPLQFLTELHLSNGSPDDVMALLNKVRTQVPDASELYSKELDQYLIAQFKRLEHLDRAALINAHDSCDRRTTAALLH